MIVVTGAAGKTGQAVLRALARRGAATRALVRPGRAAPEAAGEVVYGDLADPAALGAALRGAQAVYHICPNMHPEEIALGERLIAAAEAAGGVHVVYHSVLHPQAEAMPHHWHKLRVEERLFESRLPYTVLQPTAYMQNLLAGWPAIVERGVYAVPYPPEAALSLVEVNDVGEAAARVLTEPGHHFATYELCGTAPLTQTAVAEALSEAVGRPVRAEAVPLEAWERNARAAGLGEYAVQTLLAMFRYYARHGLAGNPHTLGWLLGRPPTPLPQFLAAAALA